MTECACVTPQLTLRACSLPLQAYFEMREKERRDLQGRDMDAHPPIPEEPPETHQGEADSLPPIAAPVSASAPRPRFWQRWRRKPPHSSPLQQQHQQPPPPPDDARSSDPLEIAEAWHRHGNLPLALVYLERSAALGNPAGQYLAGLARSHGWGCPPDECVGLRHLLTSALTSIASLLESLDTGVDALPLWTVPEPESTEKPPPSTVVCPSSDPDATLRVVRDEGHDRRDVGASASASDAIHTTNNTPSPHGRMNSIISLSSNHSLNCRDSERPPESTLVRRNITSRRSSVDDISSLAYGYISNTLIPAHMASLLALPLIELGISFRSGWGTRTCRKLAFSLIHLAAELDYPDAFDQLAFMYLNGIGTRRNRALAAFWYRLYETKTGESSDQPWIYSQKILDKVTPSSPPFDAATPGHAAQTHKTIRQVAIQAREVLSKAGIAPMPLGPEAVKALKQVSLPTNHRRQSVPAKTMRTQKDTTASPVSLPKLPNSISVAYASNVAPSPSSLSQSSPTSDSFTALRKKGK